jgi:hypothetical protein
MYLNSILNYFKSGRVLAGPYPSVPEVAALQLKSMREVVSKLMGVKDVTKLKDYSPSAVVRGALGNGKMARYLPNLQKLATKHKDKTIFAQNTDGSIAEALDHILNSGGSYASTASKLERGVPIGGMSPERDIRVGGGDYVFTRIWKSNPKLGTGTKARGVYWDIDHAFQVDSFHYDGDNFGSTNYYDYQERSAGLKRLNASVIGPSKPNNELMIKRELSLFDKLNAVVVSNEREREAVLKVFKKHGVSEIGGRAIETIVQTL